MDQDFVAFLAACKSEKCIADIKPNGFRMKLIDPVGFLANWQCTCSKALA